ncbi:MAG: hypothetical protein IPK79_11525 [Vampirovibrionales bacterium]|nr:hypothetical protein [Vampirovibrionales bacterium]
MSDRLFPCVAGGPVSQALLAQLASTIVSDFTAWKAARSPLEARWRECWQAYLCNAQSLTTESEDRNADRSRIVRPLLYEAVEAIQANLMNAMFPSDERFFSVVGKTEGDHRNAQIIEAFLLQKLQSMGFSEKFAMFLKQAIIIGSSAAAAPWRRESRQRKTYRPVELFGVSVGMEKTLETQLIYNGPDFETLDMMDFLIDPDEPDFEKATVIRRIERSLDALRRNPAYCNLEGLESHPQEEDDSDKSARRTAFGIQPAALRQSSHRQNKVTLLEAWGDFRAGDRLFENHVCVIANGDRVIRFEPNPYDHGLKPFIFTNFIPTPNEAYGIGAIEKSLGLQHAVNTLTNQKLDVINISINNPFTYLINDDVFDPDTIVTRPGALIPVKSHETLRPLTYLNNFTVAFNEIADLRNEIQEATGALKFFTGGDASLNPRTATEVSALVSGGAQKFNTFVSHLENTTLEPFLRMAFENAKQFLVDSETLRITRNDGSLEFRRILPELLQRAQCDFRIDGAQAAVTRGQEIEAMMLFARLTQDLPQIRERLNLLPLLRKIYRRLGFKDEEQVFISTQENDDAPAA